MGMDQLIGAYWQHYQLAHARGRGDRIYGTAYAWAGELVDDVAARADTGVRVGVGPVELMLKLAAHAPDEKALAYLGAGPVERYLSCGSPDLDAVDAAAIQSERFRLALRCAWFDDRLPARDSQRLRRFGPPL